jgi:hypothetical protein
LTGLDIVDMKYPNARILLFCKTPIPWEVKTRLIPALGVDGATALHEKLASRIIECVEDSDLCPLEIWTYPDIDHPFFESAVAADTTSLHVQRGADLGQRMCYACGDAFVNGADEVLLIGSDCPQMDAAYLEGALLQLMDKDAVIGPANDGGYVLLGLRRPVGQLFFGIDWSTSRVFAQTCQKMNCLDLDWDFLPPLFDIDRPEDLARLGL